VNSPKSNNIKVKIIHKRIMKSIRTMKGNQFSLRKTKKMNISKERYSELRNLIHNKMKITIMNYKEHTFNRIIN
jgi:hypothetical protein